WHLLHGCQRPIWRHVLLCRDRGGSGLGRKSTLQPDLGHNSLTSKLTAPGHRIACSAHVRSENSNQSNTSASELPAYFLRHWSVQLLALVRATASIDEAADTLFFDFFDRSPAAMPPQPRSTYASRAKFGFVLQ